MVTHDMTGPEAGTIDLDTDGTVDVTYSELEPVDMTGSTATDFVFNLPAGADDCAIERIRAGNVPIGIVERVF